MYNFERFVPKLRYSEQVLQKNKWLAEFCYNNSINASTGKALFLAIYNYQLYVIPQTSYLVNFLGVAIFIALPTI